MTSRVALGVLSSNVNKRKGAADLPLKSATTKPVVTIPALPASIINSATGTTAAVAAVATATGTPSAFVNDTVQIRKPSLASSSSKISGTQMVSNATASATNNKGRTNNSNTPTSAPVALASQFPGHATAQGANISLPSPSPSSSSSPTVISITRKSCNTDATPTKTITTTTTTTTTMTYLNNGSAKGACLLSSVTPKPTAIDENADPALPGVAATRSDSINCGVPKISLLPTPVSTPLKARPNTSMSTTPVGTESWNSSWSGRSFSPTIQSESFQSKMKKLEESSVGDSAQETNLVSDCTAKQADGPTAKPFNPSTPEFTPIKTVLCPASVHERDSENDKARLVYERSFLLSLRANHQFAPPGLNRQVLQEISAMIEAANNVPLLSKSLPILPVLTPGFRTPVNHTSFSGGPLCSPIPMAPLSPIIPFVPPTPKSPSQPTALPVLFMTPPTKEHPILGSNTPVRSGVFLFGNPVISPGVETDEARLAARQKQIDYGIETVGYQNYTRLATRTQRGDPVIPNKFQKCSKRSWDGQVRKWRRTLHFFDDVQTVEDLQRARAAVLEAAAAWREAKQRMELFGDDYDYEYDYDFNCAYECEPEDGSGDTKKPEGTTVKETTKTKETGQSVNMVASSLVCAL